MDAKGGSRTGQRSYWFQLGLVVAVGLVIRLVYVWFYRRGVALQGDPIFYHRGANLLVDGKGFIDPFAPPGRVMQSADHPPLYLMYLAFFSLVGLRSVTAHLVASSLLGSAAILVGGLAGREVAGRRVGLLTAGLMAVYPNVWRFDGMLLSETMVIFTVMLTVWLSYRCWRHPSTWMIVAVAASAAACTLVRSELGLLLPLLVVPLAIGTARRLQSRILTPLVAGSAAFLLLLAPWVVFNLSRFEPPVLLSGQFEVTLTVANCEGPYYGPLIGYWDISCGKTIEDRHGITARDSREDVHRLLLHDTIQYMRDHASRIPIVIAARVGRILGIYRPLQQIDIDVEGELFPRGVMWAATISYWLLVPFAVMGTVTLRRRRVPLYPLLAMPTSVLLTVVLFYSSMRFRASAEGVLCLAAAVGLGALLARRWPEPGNGLDVESEIDRPGAT